MQIIINKLLQKSLLSGDSVSEIKDYVLRYWQHGVHYYKPGYNINQTNLINQGILVCGEIVSNRQGWVEGCIQCINDSSDLFSELSK